MRIKRKLLTIEELKNMDGEIVQIINTNEDTIETGIVRSNRGFISGEDGVRYFFDSVGNSFYVYQIINKEMWKPCEFCGYSEYPDKDFSPKQGYLFYAGFSKQYNSDEFHEEETENVKYCPVCGRPLTDGAWKEFVKFFQNCLKESYESFKQASDFKE